MKKAFVLLEMINHMVLVAQEAKARGFEIVAVNCGALNTSGPFAVPEGLVDTVIPVESWSDAAELDAVIGSLHQTYQVVGTYTAFEGALTHEARLRELAGLPNNGSENVRRVLDKTLTRSRLYDLGLSHLRSAPLNVALTWTEWPFPGRAVVKPANGTGSALCYIVSDLDDLRAAAAKADSAEVVNPLMREYILAHGGFVVEQEAQGELLSVESLVHRGTVHSFGLMGRYVLAADPVVEMGWQFPYHHPRADEIFAAAERFHQSLGIVHGPTQIEVMVPDQGPVELIDFNIRSAGTASVVVFSEAFCAPYHVLLTDVGCGVEPDFALVESPRRVSTEMLLLPPPDAVELTSLAFPPGAICGRLSKPLGQKLTGRADQLDAIGMFVVAADTAAASHALALDLARRTLFNGEPLGDHPNSELAFSPYIGKDLATAPTTGGVL